MRVHSQVPVPLALHTLFWFSPGSVRAGPSMVRPFGQGLVLAVRLRLVSCVGRVRDGSLHVGARVCLPGVRLDERWLGL